MSARINLLTGLAAVAIVASATPAQAQQQTYSFDIPAQDLGAALRAFASRTRVQVIFDGEAMRGKRSKALKGSYTADAALAILLRGSGMVANRNAEGVLVVSRGQEAVPEVKSSSSLGDEADSGQEIVVTGTNIRGVKPIAAPTSVVSADDFRKSGFTSVQDAITALPQNFSAVTPVTTLAVGGVGSIALQNQSSASAVDLRGLGPEATLVLLNGKRHAGVIEGRAVDLSVIPSALVDRVEVVTGGQSAIYGSDAVAGVVNVLLKKEFKGAETEASYGQPSEGGGRRLRLSQTVGLNGDRAGIVVGYGYQNDHAFDLVDAGLATQSSLGFVPLYIAAQPKRSTHSASASAHFDLSDKVRLVADGFYTNNVVTSFSTIDFGGGPSSSSVRSHSEQFNIGAGLEADLFKTWEFHLSGNLSQADTKNDIISISGGSESVTPRHPKSKIISTSSVFDGVLAEAPGFVLRTALGGDWRHEQNTPSNTVDSRTRSRDVVAGFGEFRASFNEGAPSIGRIDVSSALRYDHYSDFGWTDNYQAAVRYNPLHGFALRASYATAFHAPNLYNLAQFDQAAITLGADPQSPSGTSPILFWGGGNPALEPETGKTLSVGVDFGPLTPNKIRLSVDFVRIRYHNRIASPTEGLPDGLQLTREDILAGFINRSPTPGLLETIRLSTARLQIRNFTGRPWNPASQPLLDAFPDLVVLDTRLVNLAKERFSALDIKSGAEFPILSGTLVWTFDGSINLSYKRRILPGTSDFSLLADVGRPSKFRFRTGLSWNSEKIGANIFANYVAGYPNSFSPTGDRVGSWLTFDASISITESVFSDGPLRGLRLFLTGQNITNKRPPLFGDNPYGILYDGANSNPYGRIIGLSAVKSW